MGAYLTEGFSMRDISVEKIDLLEIMLETKVLVIETIIHDIINIGLPQD